MVDRPTFPKSVRLTGRDAFGPIIRNGAFAADDTLVVQVQSNGLPISRFGITIPRRTGNAVIRNRWKRHIREALRHARREVPTGFDFVIRPKKDARLVGEKIHRGMLKLLRRALKRADKQTHPGA